MDESGLKESRNFRRDVVGECAATRSRSRGAHPRGTARPVGNSKRDRVRAVPVGRQRRRRRGGRPTGPPDIDAPPLRVRGRSNVGCPTSWVGSRRRHRSEDDYLVCESAGTAAAHLSLFPTPSTTADRPDSAVRANCIHGLDLSDLSAQNRSVDAVCAASSHTRLPPAARAALCGRAATECRRGRDRRGDLRGRA